MRSAAEGIPSPPPEATSVYVVIHELVWICFLRSSTIVERALKSHWKRQNPPNICHVVLSKTIKRHNSCTPIVHSSRRLSLLGL